MQAIPHDFMKAGQKARSICTFIGPPTDSTNPRRVNVFIAGYNKSTTLKVWLADECPYSNSVIDTPEVLSATDPTCGMYLVVGAKFDPGQCHA